MTSETEELNAVKERVAELEEYNKFNFNLSDYEFWRTIVSKCTKLKCGKKKLIMTTAMDIMDISNKEK